MIGTSCAVIRSAASTAQRKQGTPRLAQPAAQTRARKEVLRMAHALLRPTLAEAVRAIAAALSVARVGLEGRDCRACNGAHVLVVRASAAPPRLVAEVLQRVRIDPAGAQRRVICKPSGPPYPRGPIIGGAAAAFEGDAALCGDVQTWASPGADVAGRHRRSCCEWTNAPHARPCTASCSSSLAHLRRMQPPAAASADPSQPHPPQSLKPARDDAAVACAVL